jgi:phenylalanyl-tRNA synthetase beta chain
MKVSEKWLRELVDPAIDITEIGHKLTFAGVELDGVEPVASDFTQVVVGEILSVEGHPDADRLKVCQVNAGLDESIQIVTNVAYVTPGLKVPVALVGAKLPEKEGSVFKIKKSKLRGVLSQGMFCGADTLGINDGSDGLLDLPGDAPVGTDLREYLDLDDTVLEFDVTPNRADCLSMMGMARETGVLTQTPVKNPKINPVDPTHAETFPVSIDAGHACPRYAGRIIRHVNPEAETPLWLREKLRRAGIHSLGPIVDVTNYVLMELGQPMHAFDLARLNDGIQVRMAKTDEKLELLDGQTISLRDDSLVIADGSGPLALAGIMGGLSSAVTDETRDIFLESAFFTSESIAGQARSYGLHTDSSYRFERGVSPDLQITAIERATQLILEICGGEAGPVSDVNLDESYQQMKQIHLRKKRIKRVLGVDIEDAVVEEILQRLGCSIEVRDGGWDVQAPVFRFDISIEVDLIEELARIYGYDNIPAQLRPLKSQVTLKKESEVGLDKFHNILTTKGYQEVVSYSFVAQSMEDSLQPGQARIRLANPISAELSVMRSTLWSGLLKTVDHNLKRQQSRLRLFETGLTFVQAEEGLVQRKKLAGVITGSVLPVQWGETPKQADFYDAKGDVEALLSAVKGSEFSFVAEVHPALHPGQTAKIQSEKGDVGWVGTLHPRVKAELGLAQEVYLFELDLGLLKDAVIPEYHRVSPYPAIQRDLALLVGKDIFYRDIEKVLGKSEIVQLVDYYLFDSYSGKGIPDGQKSLALSLIFQDISRTLEENDIASCINQIVALLKQEVNAELRT